MDINKYIFYGEVFSSGESYPLEAAYGSRNSLLVKFDNSRWIADNTEFEKLTLNITGVDFTFSRCLFLYEHDIPNFKGRLIFIEDVYDFHTIIEYKVNSNLETYFQNLPMVFGQKQKIKEQFRQYTSDLTYDLMVYQKHFDELDSMYKSEPANVYKKVQETIVKVQGAKFFAYFDEKLDELKRITVNFTLEEHENHAYFFRRQVWNFILASSFITRTNMKPRGYAGDSEMMSIIYRNLYEGDTIFQQLMHKHPIETKSAQAVRNRKMLIPKKVEEARLEFFGEEEPFRIFSVASGAAREIENVIISPDSCRKIDLTLLDQDHEALAEAELCIQRVENRFGAKIEHKFIYESVRTMLRLKNIDEHWGQFHFIYSMGLFDYLSPRVAQAVIEKLYELLLPGGTMVIGNYHEANPTKTYMDYWCDWVLYYRSEDDFLEITKNLKGCKKDIVFDETGCQMFLTLNKQRSDKNKI